MVLEHLVGQKDKAAVRRRCQLPAAQQAWPTCVLTAGRTNAPDVSKLSVSPRYVPCSSTDGAFRVLYAAKFEDAVYVLHCFQKTTQKTEQRDIELAKARYKTVEQEFNK